MLWGLTKALNVLIYMVSCTVFREECGLRCGKFTLMVTIICVQLLIHVTGVVYTSLFRIVPSMNN